MASGGKRVGAGRKVGSLTKRTQAVARQAAAEGKTPLEVMLENMRHFHNVAKDAEAVLEGLTAEEFTGRSMSPEEQFKELLAKAKTAAGMRQMAQECARDAAPFIHARLSSVEHSGEVKTTYIARMPQKQTTMEQWQKNYEAPTTETRQ